MQGTSAESAIQGALAWGVSDARSAKRLRRAFSAEPMGISKPGAMPQAVNDAAPLALPSRSTLNTYLRASCPAGALRAGRFT